MSLKDKQRLIKQIRIELAKAQSVKDLKKIEQLIWILKTSPRVEVESYENWLRVYLEILRIEADFSVISYNIKINQTAF
jgi:hypothetical protein